MATFENSISASQSLSPQNLCDFPVSGRQCGSRPCEWKYKSTSKAYELKLLYLGHEQGRTGWTFRIVIWQTCFKTTTESSLLINLDHFSAFCGVSAFLHQGICDRFCWSDMIEIILGRRENVGSWHRQATVETRALDDIIPFSQVDLLISHTNGPEPYITRT